jgi:hypothetical protein
MRDWWDHTRTNQDIHEGDLDGGPGSQQLGDAYRVIAQLSYKPWL